MVAQNTYTFRKSKFGLFYLLKKVLGVKDDPEFERNNIYGIDFVCILVYLTQ